MAAFNFCSGWVPSNHRCSIRSHPVHDGSFIFASSTRKLTMQKFVCFPSTSIGVHYVEDSQSAAFVLWSFASSDARRVKLEITLRMKGSPLFPLLCFWRNISQSGTFSARKSFVSFEPISGVTFACYRSMKMGRFLCSSDVIHQAYQVRGVMWGGDPIPELQRSFVQADDLCSSSLALVFMTFHVTLLIEKQTSRVS